MTKVDAAFKLMVGAALLIFSLSALIYSTNPATASNSDTLYENGRYMMQYQAEYDPKDGATFWYVIVWDTQTGKSKAYYGNASGWHESASKFQLPSRPLD